MSGHTLPFSFLLLVLLGAALPAQLTWRDAGTELPPRAGHFAFFDEARGRVTLFGGQTQSGAYVDDHWQLDQGPWVQLSASSPRGRSYGACCEDPLRNGAGLVFGGNDAGGTLFSTTLRWNRDTLRFDALAPRTQPSPRWITAMALDPRRQRVVLFGGGDQSGPLRDTWEWDGLGWVQQSPLRRPTARANHAMAFDAARRVVVLYGGFNGTGFSDTWTYDGTNWTDVSPQRSPGSLHNLMLAYDEFRSVVVLFGGKDDFGIVQDAVWEWNGASWTGPIRPAVRPAARELASLTYDRQRRCVTLVGGSTWGATRLGDAWQWDGTTWTQLLPGNRSTVVQPPARSGATLGYSEQRNVSVLFGGYSYSQGQNRPLNDTWETAGGVWQRRTPQTSPPASYAGAGAINRGTGALCWVPGKDNLGNPFNHHWYFDGTDWSAVALGATALVPEHQVLGSLFSSQLGWVVVRLVTTGSGMFRASMLQLIVPGTTAVQNMFPSGGPPPLVGSTMVQSFSPGVFADRVWLFGGSYETLGGTVHSNDLWELRDTGSGGNLVWTRIVPAVGTPLPSPRRDAAVGYRNHWRSVSSPGLSLVGGQDGFNAALGDAWAYSFAAARWYQEGPPPPRRGAAMASASPGYRGVLEGYGLLFGGTDGTIEYADLWFRLGVGSAWGQIPIVDRPPPQVAQAMVYDRGTGNCLLFSEDSYLYFLNESTWRYDGTTWSPFVGRGDAAPWREAFAACYDESRATTVTFGGKQTDGLGLYQVLAETRLLSSAGQWSLGASGPPGRSAGAMVYLASQRRSLLFGGITEIPTTPTVYHSDTWLYDAGLDQWQQGPAGPSARADHAMAYDRLRDRVVLFGGRNGASAVNDTWEYASGSGWQQRSPQHQPPSRWSHAMVYDEARGRTVVSGGVQQGTQPYWNGFADVWEWDGNDWRQRVPESVTAARLGAKAAYDPHRARMVGFGGAGRSAGLGYPTAFTDAVLEIGATIDTAGAGNTASPEGLHYYNQPVLGQPLRLGFASPQGLGIYTLGFGPVQQALGPVPAPPACEPSSLYAALSSQLVFGTAEPQIAWNVPNSPLILGVTLVFQAFALQPAGCWRVTDALHVRF